MTRARPESRPSGLLALALLASASAAVLAQAATPGGSATVVMPDPDRLGGAWVYSHAAAPVLCGYMTVPMPASEPTLVQVVVDDGGSRLQIRSPAGNIPLQRVGVAQWTGESTEGQQVLRKTMRSDNAALMARALEGHATIYEGTLRPGASLVVRYILGWSRQSPDVMRGHFTSDMGQGCRITRAFELRRDG
jgi:hypothetical protein